MELTAEEIAAFNDYLYYCTDAQVQGVYDKESAAGRQAYVALVEAEALRRQMLLVVSGGSAYAGV
jgi:hypothetical protein